MDLSGGRFHQASRHAFSYSDLYYPTQLGFSAYWGRLLPVNLLVTPVLHISLHPHPTITIKPSCKTNRVSINSLLHVTKYSLLGENVSDVLLRPAPGALRRGCSRLWSLGARVGGKTGGDELWACG